MYYLMNSPLRHIPDQSLPAVEHTLILAFGGSPVNPFVYLELNFKVPCTAIFSAATSIICSPTFKVIYYGPSLNILIQNLLSFLRQPVFLLAAGWLIRDSHFN